LRRGILDALDLIDDHQDLPIDEGLIEILEPTESFAPARGIGRCRCPGRARRDVAEDTPTG